MTYTVRKQKDTITPSWAIYRGTTLVEGGFSTKWAAEECMWKEYSGE